MSRRKGKEEPATDDREAVNTNVVRKDEYGQNEDVVRMTLAGRESRAEVLGRAETVAVGSLTCPALQICSVACVFCVGHIAFHGCLILNGSVSCVFFFFFSSRRRHTRLVSDWSSDVCSSD